MENQSLIGGFANLPVNAANAFRTALDVMARPGKIADIHGAQPPAPLSAAAGTLMLTLCDPETPVWLAPSLDTAEIKSWMRFHTGAPVAAQRNDAEFAFGRWEEFAPLSGFAIGTAEYPDRSTTLIVEVKTLENTGATLRGPGIKTTASLSLPEDTAFQLNASLFPLGQDFFFTTGNRIAALPRTTKLER